MHEAHVGAELVPALVPPVTGVVVDLGHQHLAPSRAKRRTIPRPMPSPPPVTMATLSRSRSVMAATVATAAEPTQPSLRILHVMGRWLRGGVGLGLALLALGAAGPVAAASGAPAPPITVHLTLRTDHVVAGHRIKGTVALTNTTHEAITVNTCAIDGWLDVGLKSRSYSPTFAHPLVGCAPSVRIRPGTTRYPVTVVTTYGGCSQPEPSGTPPSALPICTVSDGREGPPPLPAGHYATVVEFVGLTGLAETPGRATVTLEAPAKPPSSHRAPRRRRPRRRW